MCSATHFAVKTGIFGIASPNSRAIKLSIVPPTSGTLNSTVPVNVKFDPLPVGAINAAPEPDPGAPDTATLTSPCSWSLDWSPRLGVPDFQVAAIEFGDYSGQDVAAQILGDGYSHRSVVVDNQRLQRGAAGLGGEPGQPVLLTA